MFQVLIHHNSAHAPVPDSQCAILEVENGLKWLALCVSFQNHELLNTCSMGIQPFFGAFTKNLYLFIYFAVVLFEEVPS
jgi:hypothetical protein